MSDDMTPDQIKETLEQLIDKGLVETTVKDGQLMYRLTELGKAIAPEIDLDLN